MYRLNSYQTKLLLFSTCISTIPILLLGIIFYFKSSQSIQEKVNEGNQHILEQTRLRVEQVLHGVDLSLQRLVDNKAVIQSMDRNLTPAEFQFEQELSSNLYQIQRFDFGLQDVDLIGFHNDWILSNYGLQRVSAIINQNRIKQYVNVSGNSYWTTEESSLARNISVPNERFVNLVKKIPVISDNPLGLLIAEISTHELYRLLSQDNSLGEIFIFDGTNGLLVMQNQNTAYPVSELQSFIHDFDFTAKSSGNVSAVFNHRKVGVEYQKSSYNQWLYLSIIPLDEIKKESWRTSWIILSGCLGLLVLANLFSFRYSRRLYSPIQRLYELCFNNMDPANKRSGDGNEFDIINENIAYMQNLHTRMSQQLKGQVRQLEELFVLKLVQGEFKPEEINDKLSVMVYNPPLDLKWLSVIVVQIESLEGTRYAEKDRELLQFAINNMVSDIVPKKQSLLPIIVQNHQVTILYTDQASLDEFNRLVSMMAEKIELEVNRYLGLSISIGVSRPYPRLRDAFSALLESKEALKYRLLSDTRSILYFTDIRNEINHTVAFPDEAEKSLLQAIKYAETEKIDPLMEQFFIGIMRQNGNYIDYQASFLRFFADLIRLLQDSELPLHAIYGENQLPFQDLSKFHKADELKHWFKNKIIQPMIPFFEEKNKSRQQHLSQEITRMIQEEYDTDLTLELCSSRLHYHPTYVSRVLKNELGMNFSEYLAHYRLCIAKQMLKNKNVKISEIAEKLRYHNSQNFIRYFRKIEGMTPGKYREMHGNEPE
jgi:two-component system response regulator YesN